MIEFDTATGYWYDLEFDPMKTMPFEEVDIEVTQLEDEKPKFARGLVPVKLTP